MNYIGSKLSLLDFLERSITEVVGGQEVRTFCDLFAGTGIVGRHFKSLGYEVIANDLQYYSYVLNKHYIENSKTLTFAGLIPHIPPLETYPYEDRAEVVCTYLQSLPAQKGFIYHNYCQGDRSEQEEYRLYFSNENGAKCDAIRQRIELWFGEKYIKKAEYYFLLACLLEGIDKVANTASVYGAYLKKLKTSAQKPLVLSPLGLIESDKHHQVYLSDANLLVEHLQADILYLDPPYNHRQYAANYHLLETIACYDMPQIKGKTGMREYDKQKSRYCQKAEVSQVFDTLLQKANARYIFLSYNNEGLMSLEEIQEIMSRYGTYGCYEQSYARFRADRPSEKRNIKADSTTEYLHYIVR